MARFTPSWVLLIAYYAGAIGALYLANALFSGVRLDGLRAAAGAALIVVGVVVTTGLALDRHAAASRPRKRFFRGELLAAAMALVPGFARLAAIAIAATVVPGFNLHGLWAYVGTYAVVYAVGTGIYRLMWRKRQAP
jgi:hypothetical protein